MEFDEIPEEPNLIVSISPFISFTFRAVWCRARESERKIVKKIAIEWMARVCDVFVQFVVDCEARIFVREWMGIEKKIMKKSKVKRKGENKNK